jgi:hypothetical protein
MDGKELRRMTGEFDLGNVFALNLASRYMECIYIYHASISLSYPTEHLSDTSRRFPQHCCSV